MPKIFGKYDPTEELTIRVDFETENNAIDSRTLAAILVFLKGTFDEIQRESGSTRAIAMQVRPFEKGSFGFPLDIFQYDFIRDIPAVIAVTSAIDFHSLTELLRIFIEIIRLKIELKGQKAEKVEQNDKNGTVVITANGDRIPAGQRAINIYNNSKIVNYNINIAGKSLRDDESVNEMRILDRDGSELIRLPKSTFETLGIPDDSEPEPERSFVETLPLNIYQLTFSDKHQWEFYYHGIRIRARIEDENFIARVKGGVEKFANGDVLVCDLEVGQIYDKQANTYINRYYTIKRVHFHHLRADQLELTSD